MRPPSWTTACQSTSASAVANAQSVKSGERRVEAHGRPRRTFAVRRMTGHTCRAVDAFARRRVGQGGAGNGNQRRLALLCLNGKACEQERPYGESGGQQSGDGNPHEIKSRLYLTVLKRQRRAVSFEPTYLPVALSNCAFVFHGRSPNSSRTPSKGGNIDGSASFIRASVDRQSRRKQRKTLSRFRMLSAQHEREMTTERRMTIPRRVRDNVTCASYWSRTSRSLLKCSRRGCATGVRRRCRAEQSGCARTGEWQHLRSDRSRSRPSRWRWTDTLPELRSAGTPTPILILTARDAVAARIAGLDSGADDYLLKPFDLGELLARLRALARRGAGRRNTNASESASSCSKRARRTRTATACCCRSPPGSTRCSSSWPGGPASHHAQRDRRARMGQLVTDPAVKRDRRVRPTGARQADPEGCQDVIRTRRGAGYIFRPTAQVRTDSWPRKVV